MPWAQLLLSGDREEMPGRRKGDRRTWTCTGVGDGQVYPTMLLGLDWPYTIKQNLNYISEQCCSKMLCVPSSSSCLISLRQHELELARRLKEDTVSEECILRSALQDLTQQLEDASKRVSAACCAALAFKTLHTGRWRKDNFGGQEQDVEDIVLFGASEKEGLKLRQRRKRQILLFVV